MKMNETKPKRAKRQYDDEFRRNAVALVESSARPLSEIAAELGISHWTLRDWTTGRHRQHPVAAATATETQREMARLRRENEKLQARCDILKRRWASLPNHPGTLRAYEGTAERTLDGGPVRGLWRFAERLPPLAHRRGQRAGA
jgi:transposase